jgi:hypothetical protein
LYEPLPTAHLSEAEAAPLERVNWRSPLFMHPSSSVDEVAQIGGVPLCVVAIAVIEKHMNPRGTGGQRTDGCDKLQKLGLTVQVIEPLRGR